MNILLNLSILFFLNFSVCPALQSNNPLDNCTINDDEQIYFDKNLDADNTEHSLRSTYMNTFMTAYFSNLTYNFGYNQYGSCGYVAMAMLLTYFDTFMDDDIVPESYDVSGTLSSLDANSCSSSPGSVRESSCPSQYAPFYDYNVIEGYDPDTGAPIYRKDFSLYKTWLNNNYYLTSLHAKLIVDTLGTTDYTGPGVGPSTFGNVLPAYFSGINYSSYSYIRSPQGATSDEVKAWVVDQICNYGRPVILGYPGHVTIAYDYDSSNQIVYIHQGWLNYEHVPWTGTFSDAHTIVLSNYNHNHSDNYIYGNNTYCECELSSHNHRLSCQYYDDDYHEYSCYCGYSYQEYHTLLTIGHRTICNKCHHIFF